METGTTIERDPKDIKVEGIDTSSETEQEILDSLGALDTYNATIQRRWQERIARDGKKVWVIPFERGNGRRQFESEDACFDAIIEGYSAQYQASEAAGEPEGKRMPQQIIIAPKPTVEDFMTEGQARIQAIMAQSNDELDQQMREMDNAMMGDYKASKAAIIPEGMTDITTADLSDKQLVDATRKACFAGRVAIESKLRKEVRRRGLEIEF
jgi:hypothetical protein